MGKEGLLTQYIITFTDYISTVLDQFYTDILQ